MSATIMPHGHLCDVKVALWQRRFKIAIWAILVACAVCIGREIKYQSRRNYVDLKTTTLFGEYLTLSKSVTLLIDDRGVVLKSNTYADDMFAGGENIEGRNIHDFCVDQDVRDRAIEGLARWCKATTPGEKLVVTVTAQLPSGRDDLVVTATRVPPTPGNTTAATALITYARQTTFKDLRPQPKAK